MRKVLCPICGNVIRFDEAERSLTCPVCRSLIKIKIQSASEKTVEGSEFGMPTEQLYSDDEIITAELDRSAPSLFPDEGAALSRENKPVPRNVGVRKEKTETPIAVYGVETQVGRVKVKELSPERVEESKPASGIVNERLQVAKENSEAENLASNAGATDASGTPKVVRGARPALPADSDKELQWVRWEDIECESELLVDDEVTEASEVARGKKRFRIPTDYRLAYLPIYSILTFISLILMLYTPFLQIKSAGADIINVSGAKLIGAIVTGTSVAGKGADLYLFLAGGILAAYTVLSACYLVYSFARFGEYNRRTLGISNIFAGTAALFTAALVVFFALALKETLGEEVEFLWSGVFAAVVLQAYVLISNLDKLPKYRDEKQVLLSPKSTRKKAYALLGISMFFVWALVVNVCVSVISNIAYNVLHEVADIPRLDRLSTLSLGIFGTLFNQVWSGSVSLNSEIADYLVYSYIDFAKAAGLILLIAVYAKYAGKTADIFLEEIKPKGNENVLLEDDVKERNLAKFLKKASSLSFFVYAAVLTLELAGHVVLYRGTENTLPAVFTMLSFVVAAVVRCYPYAILSREQYMKAYVEYEEMGADIPPMTAKQCRRLELYPLFIVLAINAAFIAVTMA